ncbi:MAG: zinc-ribbon domain containing protein [Acidobacteriaceae bacterium]
MQFVDRLLKCSDCGNNFVFTAGEQIFFYDKRFMNDPKRCKPCKVKRSGTRRTVNGIGSPKLPFSRTETRTLCSACGIETTVPFKPTQGRPVLCRSCYQMKTASPSVVASLHSLSAPLDDLRSRELEGSMPLATERIAQNSSGMVRKGDSTSRRAAGAANTPPLP